MKRKEDWRGIPIPMTKGQIVMAWVCAALVVLGVIMAGWLAS